MSQPVTISEKGAALIRRLTRLPRTVPKDEDLELLLISAANHIYDLEAKLAEARWHLSWANDVDRMGQ